MSDKPYISFVIAGRNDDYGGDFNERLENSVRNLSYFAEKFELPAEFIVVNYNPIEGNKSLKELINWPVDRHFMQLRIITVPPEVHNSLENPSIRDRVPLYEYIAKNVGIRRARAEYVVGANPDIIYSPEIVEFIAKRSLKPDTYYRADRCDFNKIDFDIRPSEEELIPVLQKNTFRTFLKGKTLPVSYKGEFNKGLDRLRMKNQLRLRWENFRHDTPPEFHYHCNCSGDFMGMHKDAWMQLKGNPEKTLVSAHTDALFVIMAAVKGYKEHVFRWPVFHQNHERRYTCDGEEVNPSVEIMYHRYLRASKEMLRTGKVIINNDDHWGLAQYQFEELEF